MPYGSLEELAALAEQTAGCTGSDLSVICREAAMAPLRELMQGMQVRGWRFVEGCTMGWR